MPADYPEASQHSIASITPTICDLMGVPRPRLSRCEPLAAVLAACRAAGIPKVQRCLVYAPDAAGRHLLARVPELAEDIRRPAPVSVPLRSVFPPKTPVCFASMFTGAGPESHGITEYERPVLECDTLFDSLIREHRRPAIVTVKDASVDLLFRKRSMDYFREQDDSSVTRRVFGVLEADRHDFVLAYHQEYDDVLHGSGVFSPDALAAAERHAVAFTQIADRARASWGDRSGVVIFAPDHGAHDLAKTGTGTHGDMTADDMEVIHFFGFVT